MPKSIIVEGKTTTEALEKGLKELNVPKNMVEIKQIDEGKKKSFYSILAPRIVKLELTVKEQAQRDKEENHEEKPRRKTTENIEDVNKAKERIEKFLQEFLPKDLEYEIVVEGFDIVVKIKGTDISYLIGYRGETINALQTVISTIANRETEAKVKTFLDVGGYKEKRIKTLEELADKLAKTVVRTGKAITLEPMTAYERKIIHTRLQNDNKVKTFSKGEEPYRKVVISLK